MGTRDTLIRLHRFKVDEIQRQAAALDAMRADLARKLDELDVTVARERQRASETDLARVAFPSFLRSVMARKDNINKTIAELDRQRDQIQEQLGAAFRELKKFEVAQDQARARQRSDRTRRAQAQLDEVSLLRHARGKAV